MRLTGLAGESARPRNLAMHNEMPYSGHFDGPDHIFAFRIYFEDTDAGGVVYHANYLRYMERARSDMLRLCEIDLRGSMERGEGLYVAAEVTLKYRRPAKLDDDLMVVSRVVKIGGASVGIHQRVMRGAETVTDGMISLCFVGPNGRPKAQPAKWREIFERVKGTEPADD